MTDRLVKRFDPLRVILFGSHARGTNRPHSDVDFLLVLESCDDLSEATVESLRALNGSRVPADVVVTTPEDIAEHGDLIGLVLRPALREGKVVYERG